MLNISATARALSLALLLAGSLFVGTASAAPIDTTSRPGPPDTEWNIGVPETQGRSSPRWTIIDTAPQTPCAKAQEKSACPCEGCEQKGSCDCKNCDCKNCACATCEHRACAEKDCPCMKSMHKGACDTMHPRESERMIEDRIATMRTKLGITPEQNPAWQKVEQAMRANMSSMSSTVHEKRGEASHLNAIEVLEKKQNFAQARADSLANMIKPFRDLYDSMPEAQRKNADKVFSECPCMKGLHHGCSPEKGCAPQKEPRSKSKKAR